MNLARVLEHAGIVLSLHEQYALAYRCVVQQCLKMPKNIRIS
jgi:hypothetical protein